MKFFVLTVFSFLASNSLLAGEDSPPTCKISAFENWRPHYTSGDELHQGPFIDYMREALQTAPLPVEFMPPKPNMRVFRDVSEGVADALLAGIMTPARKDQFLHSNRIFAIRTGLAYYKDQAQVPLAEARVVSFRIFRSMNSLQPILGQAKVVVEAETISQAIHMLREKRADYLVSDLGSLPQILDNLDLPSNTLGAHPQHFVETAAHFMLNKSSHCGALLDYLNAYMDEVPYQTPHAGELDDGKTG